MKIKGKRKNNFVFINRGRKKRIGNLQVSLL